MTEPSHPLPQTLQECHAQIERMAADMARQQETNEQLQAAVDEKQESNAQLQATVDKQQETIDELQSLLDAVGRDLALLKRSAFGHRRERFEDPRQGLLFDSLTLGEEIPQAPVDAEPNEGDGRRRSPGRRRRVIPECLPRRVIRRPLNEDEIPEHLRGKNTRRFFKKSGEWLEFEPSSLYVVEEHVEVLAADNEDATATTMLTAPRPPRIIDCFAGPGLLASLAVNRFADHLPYYRIEEILQRGQVVIPRSTLCRWMIRLADAVTPLVDRMRELALRCRVVQADETSVKMLVPGQPQASTAYLWAVLGGQEHPYTTFYFTEDRSRAGPDRFLSPVSGYLLSDAYVGYTSLANELPGRILLAACFAHARRKFEELHHLGATEETSTALGFFQRLYDIEDELRELADEQRHEARQLRSRPVLASFKKWLDLQLQRLRPKHELRGAITYMTKRWENFERFLESGAIPLDNNATEQAVKLAVIGKKNWIFFGSANGGEAAAVFYTLTATCRRLKIDPQAYLRDVLERLPQLDGNDLDSLLPDRWLAAHPQHRLEHRVDEAQHKSDRKRARRAQRRKALGRKGL